MNALYHVNSEAMFMSFQSVKRTEAINSFIGGGQSDQLLVTSSHRNSIIVPTIIILLHMLLFKFPDLHGASILPCLETDNTNIMNKHLHLR